jgi:hypothetical protein
MESLPVRGPWPEIDEDTWWADVKHGHVGDMERIAALFGNLDQQERVALPRRVPPIFARYEPPLA